MGGRRRNDMDFVKGILMLCVVWGHLCAYLVDNTDYSGKVLTCYTTLFQMPLFLFVSGCFQKGAHSRQDFINLTKKSAMRSGLPYISYCLLGLILILVKSFFDGIISIGISDLRAVSSVYWYFVALIVFVVFNNLACFFGGGKKWVVIVLVQFLLMLIPSHLYYISFLWIFFVSGTVYFKYEKKISSFIKSKLGIVLASALSLFTVIGGWLFPRDYTFYFLQNTFYENLSLITYRYLLYFAATICMLLILKNLYIRYENSAIVQLFCYIGTRTLTIYASHLLLIYYVAMPLDVKIMNGSFFAYYIVIPLISILVMLVLAKVEDYFESNIVLRRIMLGKIN